MDEALLLTKAVLKEETKHVVGPNGDDGKEIYRLKGLEIKSLAKVVSRILQNSPDPSRATKDKIVRFIFVLEFLVFGQTFEIIGEPLGEVFVSKKQLQMSEEVNGNAAEGYTTPTKEAASQRSYSEPLPLPPSDEIDQEVLRAVQQSQDPNLDVLLPKLGARMSSGVGMGGGASPSAVGGSEVPGGTKKDSTDQGRSGEGTFEELQAKTAGQLSVRDLHTDENSPADIALKAASTKKGRQKGLSTGASTVGTREKGEAADDDDADMMPEGNEITEEHAQYALSYGMMLGIRVTQGRRKIGECEEVSTRGGMRGGGA